MRRLRRFGLCVLGLGGVVLLTGGDVLPEPPSAKWEGPWMHRPPSRLKATLYYGPWQCTNLWMTDCRKQCSAQGHELRGCMWLADVKFDGEGKLPTPTWRMEFKAGTRYAVTHCCCDYPTISEEENAEQRRKWNRHRKTFETQWVSEMGAWPRDAVGQKYETHHIRDLHHGGHPTDRDNLLPVPMSLHRRVLNQEYSICYSGQGKWTETGSDHPYLD